MGIGLQSTVLDQPRHEGMPPKIESQITNYQSPIANQIPPFSNVWRPIQTTDFEGHSAVWNKICTFAVAYQKRLKKAINQIKTMGRPPILPKKKKDGWYIEVRNKGAKSGLILIRDSYEAMMQAARQYETTKDVIVLGEHKSGKRVEDSLKKEAKRKKEKA